LNLNRYTANETVQRHHITRHVIKSNDDHTHPSDKLQRIGAQPTDLADGRRCSFSRFFCFLSFQRITQEKKSSLLLPEITLRTVFPLGNTLWHFLPLLMPILADCVIRIWTWI